MIGDNGQSLGAYQIMNAYYTDAVAYITPVLVTMVEHTVMYGVLAVRHTLHEEVMGSYMGRYATPERLGRQPTDEDIARIHNGGPNGYRLDSTLP